MRPLSSSRRNGTDAKEDFLSKMRHRAELSSIHGHTIEMLSQLVFQPGGGPASRLSHVSLAVDDTDDVDAASIDGDGTATPSERPSTAGSDKGKHAPFNEHRALQLQAELQARLRMSVANSSRLANATTRMLPVEKVTLVTRPDAISNLGTLYEGGQKNTTAMFEEVHTFWGVWFAAVAAVKFQRPLRRKRKVDEEIRKAREKEHQRFQLEQLKHAGLAHDTRRAGRQFLRHGIQQSEGSIRNWQNQLQRETKASNRTVGTLGEHFAIVSPSSATDKSKRATPQDDGLLSLPTSSRHRKESSDGSGSGDPLTTRNVAGLYLATSKQPFVTPEAELVPVQQRFPKTEPLNKVLSIAFKPKINDGKAQTARGGPSYEEKVFSRGVQHTVQKLVQGTSYCGSLGKTLTQHTKSADTNVLAKYMLNVLDTPTPSPRRDVGCGHPKPPSTAPSRQPLTSPPPTAVTTSRPLLALGEKQRVDSLLSGKLPGSCEGSLIGTDMLSPPNALSSSRHAPQYPLPVIKSIEERGGHHRPSTNLSGRSTLTPHYHRKAHNGSTDALLNSQSVTRPFGDHPPGGKDPSTGSTNSPMEHKIDIEGSMIVKKACDAKRREAIAGLTSLAPPLVLVEHDFVDVPLPKMNATSALAYPPAPKRPAPPTRRDKVTEIELAFLRKVDSNTFHEDAYHRLEHAEEYRGRDFELKRKFLQHYAHGDDAGLTIHTLVKELGGYVDAKRKQDARMERHRLRIQWFHRFYEAMMEKCSWVELEPLLLIMEAQIMDEFAPLQFENFKHLFDAAVPHLVSLPGVQFFLCHVAIAYSVPYIEFRELLELSHTPYVLQGNGEMFVVHQSEDLLSGYALTSASPTKSVPPQ